MNKLSLFFALAVLATACNTTSKGYTIQGNISGTSEALANGKAILTNSDKTWSDTAIVTAGKFEFKGAVSAPEKFSISIEGLSGNAYVFLENDKYNVTCTEDALATSGKSGIYAEGGTINSTFKEYNDALATKKAELRVNEISKEYYSSETPAEKKAELQEQLAKANKDFGAWSEDYTKKMEGEHPHTHFTLEQISSRIYNLEADEIKTLIAEYQQDDNFKDSKTLARLEKHVATLEATAVGAQAPDFALNDPDGNPIKFSDVYKANKITMIDFWASWCGPCRRANPTIVAAYKKYHKKGFEIFGVSLDREKANWVKAIADDGLVWPNVSDLKYWDCSAGRLYAIRFIPQNVFVDAEGKIIAKRIEPEKIDEFLASQFNK